MLSELGSFSLILALCFALIQGITPIIGFYQKNSGFYVLCTYASFGQFIFLGLGMIFLISCFFVNDMTVLYVREHSHDLLPLIYKIGAAWGGHEGSLLLWCLILSAWTVFFILFSTIKNETLFFNKIKMILGWISFTFIAFLYFTSNPFTRDFPDQLIVGRDLTPLLQDPGLIFHPPMLYLGYIGFVISYAFAVSALLEGRLETTWVNALKPWIILPWTFLGTGIILGSWWAYRTLGWGGWWFWDPVENASLLPWLIATALIHSLIVTEKRGAFKGWTLLLAIISFSLSLIGTFLVRSGVLVSVHAFASDPSRGIVLLCILTFIIGGALLLYSLRIKHFFQAPEFHLVSRETLLLLNSIFLLSAMVTIMIGTIYPIILESLSLDKISVGEPYFNTVFLPIMLPLALLIGFAPHITWQQHSLLLLWKKLRFTFIFSLFLGFIVPIVFKFPFDLLGSIGIALSVWIIIATLQYFFKKSPSLKQYAMMIAHVGIGVMILGITINKTYSVERQVKMNIGETVSLAGYDFKFLDITEQSINNYRALNLHFLVHQRYFSDKIITASARLYTSHEQMISIPGVLYNPLRDLYLALGSPYQDGGWAVRIYYKPCVRWIWFGGFLLVLGGLIALIPNSTKARLVV